ncbi:MAG: ABC transporter substrate-binding protein [Spirochaetales bacterium]|nr:ABC transporter substrate-binding protein [Spirochaetales bacterium]
MKRLLILLSIFFTASFVFAGGAQETQTSSASVKVHSDSNSSDNPDWLVENTEDHIIVLDNRGNEVTIKKPVKKIISLGMGELYSCARAIDAKELIISVNSYVSRNLVFFPDFANLPVISDSQDGVDQEKILEMDPDVIFMKNEFYGQINDTIRDSYPTVYIAFDKPEDIEMFGAIVGKEDEAAEYFEWMNGYLNMIDSRISQLAEEDYQDVFVFYGGEYGMTPPPPYGTFGKANLRNEIIRRAGGINIAENLDGDWITVDPEWLIEKDPEMIVREFYITTSSPAMGYSVSNHSDAATMLQTLIKQPAIEATTAVKTGNVSMIFGDIFEDSWFVGVAYLAKLFHPDLFEDLDPVKMHQEFLNHFQGLDYDMNTQGVFVESLK